MGYLTPDLPELNFLLLDNPLLVSGHKFAVEGVELLMHY